MIRIGKLIIATSDQFYRAAAKAVTPDVMADAVAKITRELSPAAAALVNQDLLRAAMAADAFLHEDPTNPAHEAHRLAVCELLVDAISPALAPRAKQAPPINPDPSTMGRRS